MYSGVNPSLFALSIAAPLSSSSRTTSRYPFWLAVNSGVVPSLRALSIAAPLSSSSRTTARCPFWLATYSGVVPVSVFNLSTVAPLFSSRRTTSRCPLQLAAHSGVLCPLWLLCPAAGAPAQGAHRSLQPIVVCTQPACNKVINTTVHVFMASAGGACYLRQRKLFFNSIELCPIHRLIHFKVVTCHWELRPMCYIDPNFIKASNEQTQA
uniref:Uncharacterized protein n=1 Tax=Dunaliella tertiolecta TaxID=3047 RepID=A0A7S3VLV7_DUNTE